MKWDEFRALLSGISHETVLGKIVEIRLESDQEILKTFTPDQKRIRDEWRSRNAKNVTKEELGKVLDDLKATFIRMAGEDYAN